MLETKTVQFFLTHSVVMYTHSYSHECAKWPIVCSAVEFGVQTNQQSQQSFTIWSTYRFIVRLQCRCSANLVV